MRKHGHMFIGAIFFILAILVFDYFGIRFPYWLLPFYLLFTIIGSRMPDWIEPSSRGGYKHRGLFHSRVMLFCLLVAIIMGYLYVMEPWFYFLLLNHPQALIPQPLGLRIQGVVCGIGLG